jgi:acetyl-CoA hydrolase
MSEYGTLQDRVRCKSLLDKVMTAEECIPFFKDGMNLGWSGFTPAGYPKMVPIALAEHVEKNNLQGKLKFSLFIGASVGAETEKRYDRPSLAVSDRKRHCCWHQRWSYPYG